MINTNYTSHIIYKLKKLNEGLFSYLSLLWLPTLYNIAKVWK
jgi:hypothetical protein